MLKLLIQCIILSGTILYCSCDAMIGPGKWRMLKMEKSGGDFDDVELNMSQRKLNRTHDCFQGSMVFHKELGQEYGAKIDICKYVDGGCKQFQVLSDDSFQSMVEKHAKQNFEDMMKLSGVTDFKFPIPPGEYHVKDYIFNYNELPAESCYGRFLARACCMKGTVETGCISLLIEFVENCDDDDDDDEQ